MRSRKRRFGFTLVEVLVTTIVIGVLAAVVVPAMMRQTTAADPAQMASDLINIRTGLESFMVDVRPYTPGDLEDLVNPIVDASDLFLTSTGGGTAYPSGLAAKWKGPYLAKSTAVTTNASGNFFGLGSAGFVDLDLFVCSAAAGSSVSDCVATTSGSPDYTSIKLTGITQTEFTNLNQLIDGTETSASTTGVLRTLGSGTTLTVYFLAAPYTAP